MDIISTKPHTVMLESRKAVNMTGVEKVINSSDDAINLLTAEGGLNVFGKDLKIQRFNVDDGTLIIEGLISELKYASVKTPFFKRIFK